MNKKEYEQLQKERMLYANVNSDGEIESLTVPWKKSKSQLGKGWLAMFQDALNWVAKENLLSKEEYRVFFGLMSTLDFENFIRVTQSEVAKDLDMKQPHVSRAMKGLLEKDIIRKGPKVGNANTYRLNPYIGHKGQAINKTKKEYEHLHRIK